MELQMRGIDYALLSSSSTPLPQTDQENLSNILQTVTTRVEERIEQVRCYSPFPSKIESETTECMQTPPSQLHPNLSHGWLFLFFSCVDTFLNDTFPPSRKLPTQTQTQTNSNIIARFKFLIQNLTTYKRVEFASKCSISLSLAMLLGLTFDKENGCWAGLTIAISFVTGRQAIFTIANSRLQGTAIGSAYGVICCFVFRHAELRLVALLPWVVLVSLLRYSKMYGSTGGVSAAIGALVILGRKNYGVPNEFAIARLTEVFIGLSAFIVVEIFLQPFRAGTLAQNHAYKTLRSLLAQLKDYVVDAEMEPDFWYLPFRSSCYKKLVGSLSNILDMLHFINQNFEELTKISETDNGSKFKEEINNEIQILQESLRCLSIHQEEESTTEGRAITEEEMEAGKVWNQEKHSVVIQEQEETEWAATEEDCEDDTNMKGRIFKCVSATGFCINSVMKELEEVEMCMREIQQW